jgi:hypothetical protein
LVSELLGTRDLKSDRDEIVLIWNGGKKGRVVLVLDVK